MTPKLTDILIGQAVAIATPQPPEASGDYMVARLGMVAMLSTLAAQEAERGPAARLWENKAISDLLAAAAGPYADVLGDGLVLSGHEAEDKSWSGLDRANADLRRRLIALHVAVEARGDAALERRILELYVEMARARRLDLPAALA